MPVREEKEGDESLTAFKSDRLSYKERRVDAWALRAEEGRDKLRKAAGRSKYLLIHGYPNGETRLMRAQSL